MITEIIEIVNETLLGCLRHQDQGLDARPDHQRYAIQQILEAAWGVVSACFKSEDLRSLAAPEAWHCTPVLSRALQHKACSAAGLTLVSSWDGGAVGGEVLLTKRPSGLLSMPAVRFRVMTMEVPSNQ